MVRNDLVLSSSQRGFALASAIVLLVLFAGLGLAMLSLGTGQQMGFALDLNGSRAQAAARSGVEWTMFQVVRAHNQCAAFQPAQRVTITGDAAFPGISVTIRCVQLPSDSRVFVFNAIACNQPDSNGECLGNQGGGNPLYVERFAAGGLCVNVADVANTKSDQSWGICS